MKFINYLVTMLFITGCSLTIQNDETGGGAADQKLDLKEDIAPEVSVPLSPAV